MTAKPESAAQSPRYFVTKTSRINDKDGNAIPRGRVVQVHHTRISNLVKEGHLRPADASDLEKARAAFQKPVMIPAI